MRNLLIILLVFAASVITAAQTPDSSSATLKGKVVRDDLSGNPMLLGYFNRQAFKDTSFSWWFNSMYDIYNVDSATADQLKDKIKNVSIEIVMGTWCSDSRREVPRLFKILDYLNYPSDSVKILMVGRDKKAMDDETKGLDIQLVPTIIFSRDGKEIGRIIESPKVSLEKDMLKILNG
jgi:hypothetical protein